MSDVLIAARNLSLVTLEDEVDADDDGLTNSQELLRGTHPFLPDTDGDGLTDAVEDGGGTFVSPMQTVSNPLLPDTDGDGVSDDVEVSAGSDPSDPDDLPAVVTLDLELPAGGDRSWTVRGDGSVGEVARDPVVSTFSSEGGFQLVVGTAPFPTLTGVFKGAQEGEFVFGPVPLRGLSVTRRVFAAPDRGFIRYFDSFDNSSDEEVRATVQIRHEFFHAPSIEIESTSDGDVDWEVADTAVHFNNRDPADEMPSFLWIVGGDGRRETPENVTTTEEMAVLQLQLEIPPGERRAFLHFGALDDDLSRSKATLEWMLDNPLALFQGITAEQKAATVNMSLDRDGLPGFYEVEHDLDPDDPDDVESDLDNDGLTNREEFQAGSDPRNPDTDGDGLDDGEDPFPAAVLIAAMQTPEVALLGDVALLRAMVLSGDDVFEGDVRFSIQLDGGEAVFTDIVQGGEVLGGLGRNIVRVEVRGGSLEFGVEAIRPGEVTLSIIDSEGLGISAPTTVLEDFEASAGGFEARGTRTVWEWGAPSNPPGAPSGRNAWETALASAYPNGSNGSLLSPEFRLAPDGDALAEIRYFLEVEEEFDFGLVAVIADGQATGVELPFGTNTPEGFRDFRIDLRAFRGSSVQLDFRFVSDGSVSRRGWIVDDFLISGIESRGRLFFLDPNGDEDADGIATLVELEAGTNPLSSDSDSDGLVDGAETGTGVFHDRFDTGTDPIDPDTDAGGELDGLEVDAGRNPLDPVDDFQLINFDLNDFLAGVEMTDFEARRWLVHPTGSLSLFDGEELAPLTLGFLSFAEDAFFFFADSGYLTQQGRMLLLDSPPFVPNVTTRTVFVHPDDGWMRWVELFHNPTSVPEQLSIQMLSLLWVPTTRIVKTSSGDLFVGPEDSYFVVDFPEREIFYGHVFRSPNADPWNVEFRAGEGRLGEEALGVSVRIPKRSFVGVAHFVSVASDLERVERVMKDTAVPMATMMVGLTNDEQAAIVNFFIDQDGDGLSDNYEQTHGLNPRDPDDAGIDSDGDGLVNSAEAEHGTDPREADTDGDGLSDSQELELGTAPLERDSDNDGAVDGEDAFPLTVLAARLPRLTFGPTGEPTRLRVIVDAREVLGRPAQTVGVDAVLRVAFSAPIEIGSVEVGEQVGADPEQNSFDFRPTGDGVVFSAGSAEPGDVTVTVSDAGMSGIRVGTGTIRFVLPDAHDDGDRIPNALEIIEGTDPTQSDSDGDGLGDNIETGSGVHRRGLEVASFPFVADSDAGGLSDGAELDRRSGSPLVREDDTNVTELPRALGDTGWQALSSWAVSEAGDRTVLDNGAALLVDGHSLPALNSGQASPDGNVVELGPVRIGDLAISRRIVVLQGPRLFRFEDHFVNRSDAPIQVTAELRFDLSADARTEIVQTSNGDDRLEPRDTWVLVGDSGGTALHVFGGTGSVSDVSVNADLLRESFAFEVPPEKSASLVHFLSAGRTLGNLVREAARIYDREPGFFSGLKMDVFMPAVNLVGFGTPVVWERFPRRPIAPGEMWSLRGDFLSVPFSVSLGETPVEIVSHHPESVVLSAPGETGTWPVRLTTTNGREVFTGLTLSAADAGGHFRRGDVVADGSVRLNDAVRILLHLFQGQPIAGCLDAADVDDSGDVKLADAVFLLDVLFRGAGPIVAPGAMVPGPDLTPDENECP